MLPGFGTCVHMGYVGVRGSFLRLADGFPPPLRQSMHGDKLYTLTVSFQSLIGTIKTSRP